MLISDNCPLLISVLRQCCLLTPYLYLAIGTKFTFDQVRVNSMNMSEVKQKGNKYGPMNVS